MDYSLAASDGVHAIRDDALAFGDDIRTLSGKCRARAPVDGRHRLMRASPRMIRVWPLATNDVKGEVTRGNARKRQKVDARNR